MSNSCQKITVRTVSHQHTTSDITDFVSGVSSITLDILDEYNTGVAASGEPLFMAWADSYSAQLIDTYSTVNENSSVNWNYQGNDIKTLTGEWENSTSIVKNNSALWILSGLSVETDPIFTAWAQTYSGNFETAFNNLISNSAAYLTSVDLTEIATTSSEWNSTYNTVLNNSAIVWNYQGTDLKLLSGDWDNISTTVKNNSALWILSGLSVESDPIFTSWAQSYSALLYSTTNTVNANSGIWSSTSDNTEVNTFVNTNSSDTVLINSTVKNNSALWILSGGSGSGPESDPIFTAWLATSSDNIQSLYSTVNTYSSVVWNYQGNDIKTLTGEWENTSSVVKNNSALWILSGLSVETDPIFTSWAQTYSGNYEIAFNNLISNSAAYLTTTDLTEITNASGNWNDVYNNVNSNSGNWNYSYSTVNSNSATTWNYQGNDIKALTGNWQNTYIGFSSQSANNVSVYSSVNSKSANWDSVYTDVSNTSGSWNDTTTSVQTNSSFWEYYDYSYKGSYRYSTSDAPFYDVKNVVINDQQVYDNLSNPLNTPDGNLYLCIKTLPNPYGYPAPVDENGTPQTEYWKLLEVDSVLAKTANSVYSTVQTNSATWGSGNSPQTLSFNESNAELTISDGNTVSLSSLSGGGNGSVGVNYLSALYDVSIPSPVNGQVLTYNSITDKWNAGTPLSASGATGYYGSFYDTTAQTLTSTTQAKRINIAQTYEQNGVSIDNNRIIFNYNGVYELIYSIQYKNTSNAQQDIYIWLKQNGNDIPNSSSVFTIPAHKNASIPAQLIAVSPFMSTLTAGDFIELYWHCNNTSVTVETFTTHANPTIPDTPGVIVTVKQVTNVQIVPTVGAYLPLSGGTLTGAVSTTNVLYTTGGNSDQWNSTYSTVQSNSSTNWNYQGTDIKALTANWQNTYTSFSSQSANNLSVYSIVQTNSATTWNYQGTDLKLLSGDWDNIKNVVNNNSALWIIDTDNVEVNSFVNTNSAELLLVDTIVKNNSALWILSGISTETDPIFTTWAQSYSSVYTTTNTNSGLWSNRGKNEIWVDAGAMAPQIGSPAQASTICLSSNFITFDCYNFDAGTAEYVHFKMSPPLNWDLGNFKTRFYWTSTTGTVGTSAVFAIQSMVKNDSEAIDQAWGTPVSTTDELITLSALHISNISNTITFSGTPTQNSLIFFRIYRSVSDLSDNLATDARLLGIKLQFGTLSTVTIW